MSNRNDGKIRVALAGVGNNASALVQGTVHYSTPGGRRDALEGKQGIRFPRMCGYEVGDIEYACAFDVDARKVHLDLGRAVFAAPNCYPRVLGEPPTTGVVVQAAPLLDGVPPHLAELVEVARTSSAADEEAMLESCAAAVKESRTDVLINFLPSGSTRATEFFARVAAAGNAAYVNCTPAPAAHSPAIAQMFREARLPLLGDDLESHFGSSFLHRTLLQVLRDRGLELRNSYQINIGGNADFKNLTHRSDAKKKSKLAALGTLDKPGLVEVIPSGGYIAGLQDHKIGYISVEGRGWLDMPVCIDVKLAVQDSSNALGVTVDLIRLARGLIDRKLSGPVPLSYYFKNPTGTKLGVSDALRAIERFEQGGEL